MRTLRIPLIILALVGLIAVAGCGGDDDTSTSAEETTTEETTSEEALSAEEYSTEVQSILTEFGTNFQELGSQISAAGSPDEFSGLVDDAESEIQSAIDEFAAITPPEEAQEGHDQVLAALEDFSSKLTDVSDAAESGDDQALADAATALQSAGFDFQDQLLQAQESLQDAGIELGGASTGEDSETPGG